MRPCKKNRKKPPRKYERKRPCLPLRLEEAKSLGRVLDVSRIQINGTGISITDPPSSLSKKIGPPELGIISDNGVAFELAIVLLGPGYSQWHGTWEMGKGQR
jgi:hypothetical protein